MSPNAISNILSISDVSEKSRGRSLASMKSGKFIGIDCKFANCLTKSDQKVCNFLYEQHISMKNSRNCYSAQFFEYFSSIFCMKKSSPPPKRLMRSNEFSEMPVEYSDITGNSSIDLPPWAKV